MNPEDLIITSIEKAPEGGMHTQVKLVPVLRSYINLLE